VGIALAMVRARPAGSGGKEAIDDPAYETTPMFAVYEAAMKSLVQIQTVPSKTDLFWIVKTSFPIPYDVGIDPYPFDLDSVDLHLSAISEHHHESGQIDSQGIHYPLDRYFHLKPAYQMVQKVGVLPISHFCHSEM
jgi:hypothetical protein